MRTGDVAIHHPHHRTVLVLGDDARLGRLVKLALEPAGYAVEVAETPSEALEITATRPPDLVALELRFRARDGVAFCEQLHALADVPVVFLSAADDDASKVRALRCGDDYVTRPFSPAELRARVEAVLRRARPCFEARGVAYQDPLLVVDLQRHQVGFAGVNVDLTPLEYRLLALLARYPGRVFLHDEILSRVWGEAYQEDAHVLRLHVANLRKKIEPDPAHPRYLRTHRGLGYSFTPPTSTGSTRLNEPTLRSSTEFRNERQGARSIRSEVASRRPDAAAPLPTGSI